MEKFKEDIAFKRKKKKIKVMYNIIDKNYEDFFNREFDVEFIHISKVSNNNYEDIDLLLFTGGSDVNPSLYNENKGRLTFIDESRDKVEAEMFYNFIHIPKIGICRGAQFLTVMNGGKLVQHVENHTQTHKITLLRKFFPNPIGIGRNSSVRTNQYEITSTHHQMMYPFNLKRHKFELIGWSKYNRSSIYLDGKNEQIKLPDDFLEPEIVFFKNTSSLCIQGHPEFPNCNSSTKKIILNLIKNKLLK